MTDAAANPLLDMRDLPRFDAIAPTHIAPALDVLLSEAERARLEIKCNALQVAEEAVYSVA